MKQDLADASTCLPMIPEQSEEPFEKFITAVKDQKALCFSIKLIFSICHRLYSIFAQFEVIMKNFYCAL